jgi:hypothetical protein
MGARTRADLMFIISTFQDGKTTGAFLGEQRNRVALSYGCGVSDSYIFTVPCTVRPVVKRRVGGGWRVGWPRCRDVAPAIDADSWIFVCLSLLVLGSGRFFVLFLVYPMAAFAFSYAPLTSVVAGVPVRASPWWRAVRSLPRPGSPVVWPLWWSARASST